MTPNVEPLRPPKHDDSTEVWCAICLHSEFLHAEDGNRRCLFSVCECNRFVVGAVVRDPTAGSPLPGIRARSSEGWGTDTRSVPQPSGVGSWAVVPGNGVPSIHQVEDDDAVLPDRSGEERNGSPRKLVSPLDALALARAVGQADRYTVDLLLDDFGITSSEKAADLVGYLCGLLIGLAQLLEARTGESWEDLLTKLVKVANSISE
jgi:hypothetical protein